VALSKTVFIERTSRSQAVAAFDKAAQQMHSERQSVYIFPEGTRSYYDHPDLLPFKKGAFHLAIQAQVPVVPIVVANYSNVLNMKRKIFTTGRIPIRVLEPISTKGKTKEDVDGLLQEVREKMLNQLKDMHEKVKADGIAVKQPTGSQSINGPAKSTAVDVATT
jgi:lysophosphatidate acyltransferase